MKLQCLDGSPSLPCVKLCKHAESAPEDSQRWAMASRKWLCCDCLYKERGPSYWCSMNWGAMAGKGSTCALGESHNLGRTHHQLLPGLFGADAARSTGIPGISLCHPFFQTLHPSPYPGKSLPQPARVEGLEAGSLLPSLPLQSYLSKGLEQRCEGVRGTCRVQKKESNTTKAR